MAEAKTNAELLKLVAGDDIRAFEALYQKFSGRQTSTGPLTETISIIERRQYQ